MEENNSPSTGSSPRINTMQQVVMNDQVLIDMIDNIMHNVDESLHIQTPQIISGKGTFKDDKKCRKKIFRRFSLQNVKRKWTKKLGGGKDKQDAGGDHSSKKMSKTLSKGELKSPETCDSLSSADNQPEYFDIKKTDLECLLQCCRLLRRCLLGRSEFLHRRIQFGEYTTNLNSPLSCELQKCNNSWQTFD